MMTGDLQSLHNKISMRFFHEVWAFLAYTIPADIMHSIYTFSNKSQGSQLKATVKNLHKHFRNLVGT